MEDNRIQAVKVVKSKSGHAGATQRQPIRVFTPPPKDKSHFGSSEETVSTLKRRKAPRFRDHRRPLGEVKLMPVKRPERETTDDYMKQDSLKITHLGGLGEVGRNMQVLEYKEDIILVDAGLGFPEDNQPGIDFNLPNVSYLEGKQDRIRGLVITHGHYDHIGALPYIIEKIGNPPIYTSRLTGSLVLKRHQEFPHLPEMDITEVNHANVIQLGKYFKVEFFHVNHNIPEDLGLIIDTPSGRLVHTSDFKFDEAPLNDKPTDLGHIKGIGDRGITLLMSDSTGAEKPGASVSETTIHANLEEIFKASKGRIITATYASLINRIQQLIDLSEKYGRKVAIDGYSMKTNVEILKELGQINIKKGTQITVDQIDNYPDNQITVIGTGAQGERPAVMMRIAAGEHRYIQLRESDTVIFSSSVVPGNERTVQRLRDLLYRLNVNLYHYNMMDIHTGGHALQEDLKKMVRLIRPKFFLPNHGFYSMMITHGRLAQEEGIPKENVIIPDNGSILHLTPNEWWFDKKTAPVDNIMVDGLGVGDIGNVVIRDRQVLAADGMFVIICVVDSRSGKLRGSPDIISRGFVYLKENKDLLAQVRKRIKSIIDGKNPHPQPAGATLSYLKDEIRNQIGLFLFQKTERRPMVLPVLIEV